MIDNYNQTTPEQTNTPRAGYDGFTVQVGSDTVNPFRKNSYDPDFECGADALNVRYSARWKGYNGYWKTMLSLKEVQGRTRVIAATPRFNLAYHYNTHNFSLADIRRRGMYGY